MLLLTLTALVLLVALHLLGAKTPAGTRLALLARSVQIGRASCRERVYVLV